jgi:hypothetical protein
MRRHLGAAVLATLSLAWTTYGFNNYTSLDMMRTQLALMDDRPDDCPPWYDDPIPTKETQRTDRSQF